MKREGGYIILHENTGLYDYCQNRSDMLDRMQTRDLRVCKVYELGEEVPLKTQPKVILDCADEGES